ncbi:unnamed protein product, partial [Mesorhabditis belari]|uniref:Potassium channel domain-containing protein n=1 Tax=Mesorhabditis belari TaxID=2138241 RepID=A0AAF3J6Z0_9BILA
MPELEWRSKSTGKTFHHALPSDIFNPPPGARKYGLLFFWRTLGIKHFIIAGLLIGASLLGGVIFYHIEHDAEIDNVANTNAAIEAKIAEYVQAARNNASMNASMNGTQDLQDFIKRLYVDLQKTEGIYKASVYYKNDTEDNLMWQYWPSVFYASNIYMTTGYGTQIVYSTRGRIFSILYGFISLPFLCVLCRDLGQWWLVCMTRVYAKFLIRFRKSRGIETNPKEEISLPLTIIVIYFWLNICFCGALTYAYDVIWGKIWGIPGMDEPMGFWDGCYYTFITISGMGMSDDVPRNATTAALPLIWFVLSMPIFQMGIRVFMIYEENAILGTLAAVEWQLAKWDGFFKSPKIEGSKHGDWKEAQQPIPYDVGGLVSGQADAYAGEFGRVRLRRSTAQK